MVDSISVCSGNDVRGREDWESYGIEGGLKVAGGDSLFAKTFNSNRIVICKIIGTLTTILFLLSLLDIP